MTTQSAEPTSGVEQRLAGIEARLAALEATVALFIAEQREFREQMRAEQRESREQTTAEQREFREQMRAEQREFRQENNARLGRIEINLTRVFFTIVGLMGTVIVGAVILSVLG